MTRKRDVDRHYDKEPCIHGGRGELSGSSAGKQGCAACTSRAWQWCEEIEIYAVVSVWFVVVAGKKNSIMDFCAKLGEICFIKEVTDLLRQKRWPKHFRHMHGDECLAH